MDPATVSTTRQTIDVVYEISQLLDTGLDKETLTIALGLIQQGVNPEGLAKIIQELRNSTQSKGDDVAMTE